MAVLRVNPSSGLRTDSWQCSGTVCGAGIQTRVIPTVAAGKVSALACMYYIPRLSALACMYYIPRLHYLILVTLITPMFISSYYLVLLLSIPGNQ